MTTEDHGPQALIISGIAMGFGEFMDALVWMGEHADGLGILLSAVGVIGGLYWTRRRTIAIEKQNKINEQK